MLPIEGGFGEVGGDMEPGRACLRGGGLGPGRGGEVGGDGHPGGRGAWLLTVSELGDVNLAPTAPPAMPVGENVAKL